MNKKLNIALCNYDEKITFWNKLNLHMAPRQTINFDINTLQEDIIFKIELSDEKILSSCKFDLLIIQNNDKITYISKPDFTSYIHYSKGDNTSIYIDFKLSEKSINDLKSEHELTSDKIKDKLFFKYAVTSQYLIERQELLT